MPVEPYLKQKNNAALWLFLILNLGIFAFLFFTETLLRLPESYKSLTTIRSLGILLAPFVLFVLNGLITSNQKAILVFWKLKNNLPGYRAFTKYAIEDGRINIKKLAAVYGQLPKIQRDQNLLWYKIYRNNKDEIVVQKSHKDFLLAADLASLTFLFLVVLAIPAVLISDDSFRWLYLIIIFVEYLLMVRLAQTYGVEFVKNVLAIESSK